jgi:TolB protein
LNNAGDRFVFAQKVKDSADNTTEIYTLGINGVDLKQLTSNNYRDLYPAWSSDDKRIAFLSWRGKDLDIYVMDADGKNEAKLYDSGDHDADIDWVANSIVFTSGSAVWLMKDDGTQAMQITRFPEMGKWGSANLPAGDYDPRLSPDGREIAFERLENTADPHGGYNIFTIGRDGEGEVRLTSTGYSQGLVNWSHSGKELVYSVAAVSGQGEFDIYIMNSDGTNNRNVTPEYFPADFLCSRPCFSLNDSGIFFLGQWWENQ